MGYHGWDDPQDVAVAKNHAANLLAQHAKKPVVHVDSPAVAGIDHVVAGDERLRRKIAAFIATEKRKALLLPPPPAKAGVLGRRPLFD